MNSKAKFTRKRIKIVLVSIVGLCVVTALFSFTNDISTGKKRPNVIIILADDLGKYDVSAYGGVHVSTPNIDAIGANGCMFNDGYATASICAPSRAALLTGEYQQRFGFEFQPEKMYPRNALIRYVYNKKIDHEHWAIECDQDDPSRRAVRREGMPVQQLTIAELFKSNGYSTGLCGKWHLGNHAPHLPNNKGFDFHYGFYEAYSLYALPSDTSIVHAHTHEFTDSWIWKHGRSRASAIRVNDSIVQEKGYLTFRIAEEANNYIERNKDNPFMLYVAFNAPHAPFQVPKKYFDMFSSEKDSTKRVYYGMIKALDDAVGSITQKLKDLGLDDNTIVIFASDNGAATYTGVASNFPLKGGKLTLFEGGINVPFLMQWKGGISAGNVVKYPVSLMDVMPTVMAAAGIQFPANTQLDGVNLLPYIRGQKTESPHQIMCWRTGYNKVIREGQWKLMVDEKQKKMWLYNLDEDKGENNDVKDNYKAVIEQLVHDLDAWDKEMTHPMWPYIMNYRIFVNGETYTFAV